MPKVRVYYDGSGAIVGIEHRPDETYDDSNAAAYEGKTVTWNVVESAELDVASADAVRLTATLSTPISQTSAIRTTPPPHR